MECRSRVVRLTLFFFFSSRRRHTRCSRDWSSDVCSSDLTEHWDGPAWSVVSAVDAGSSGNQLYAVKALATDDVYAVGQQAGAGVPNQALIEHWNGKSWSVVSSPADASASVLPLGVTATSSTLTLVGEQETDMAPYTSYVAAGAPGAESIQTTPNAGTGENDLFAAATAADGTTWAVGWDINTSTGNHDQIGRAHV